MFGKNKDTLIFKVIEAHSPDSLIVTITPTTATMWKRYARFAIPWTLLIGVVHLIMTGAQTPPDPKSEKSDPKNVDSVY